MGKIEQTAKRQRTGPSNSGADAEDGAREQDTLIMGDPEPRGEDAELTINAKAEETEAGVVDGCPGEAE